MQKSAPHSESLPSVGRIIVLRINHRPFRDKRITTHVALTARAMGADEIVVDTNDAELEDGVKAVTRNFGGNFSIRTGLNPSTFLSRSNGVIVHLTMYGVPVDTVIHEIREKSKGQELVIVVGASKVPREFYGRSDFNVSVTNQPISEVSALAVFLDRFYEGAELKKDFNGTKTVVPSRNGKRISIIHDERECLDLLN